MLDGLDASPEHSRASTEPASVVPSESRLVDSFAGRVLVQGVSLLAVAAIVANVVDQRAAETSARLTELESQLQLVQHERDRMQRLSSALTTELNEAAVEAEIVRWQLSYTEERYARLHETTHDLVTTTSAVLLGLTPTSPPGPPATFESLDPTHGASPDALGDHAAMLPAPTAILALADSSESRTDAAPALQYGQPHLRSTGRLIDLEPLDGSGAPPTVHHPASQLDRDRAFSIWQEVIQESASRECDHRTGAAERRCRTRVKRTLIPMGTRAVECILSGNASADYVANIPLDELPTHSVPLDQGAVILCDRGLRNL
jgi:hypothetical protein